MPPRRFGWVFVFALAQLGLVPSTVVPNEPSLTKIVLHSEMTVTVAPDLKGERRLKATQAMVGRRIVATVREPVLAMGCEVVKEGAEATLLVREVSSPQSRGIPGHMVLELAAITLADGTQRSWYGGETRILGADRRSDPARLFLLPRRGGPAVLQHQEPLVLPLVGPQSSADQGYGVNVVSVLLPETVCPRRRPQERESRSTRTHDHTDPVVHGSSRPEIRMRTNSARHPSPQPSHRPNRPMRARQTSTAPWKPRMPDVQVADDARRVRQELKLLPCLVSRACDFDRR